MITKNIVKLILDLETGEWSTQEHLTVDSNVEFQLAFKKEEDAPFVFFKDLHFTFILSDSSGVVTDNISYPRKGNYYICTDQEYLECLVKSIPPEEVWKFTIVLNNNGRNYQVDYSFTGRIPDAPGSTWTWDSENKQWNPPFPPPEDHGVSALYAWDENIQNWRDAEEIKLDSIIEAAGEGTADPEPEEITVAVLGE